MSQVVDALEEIERELSREKGPFTLFAVFEREDIPSRWDLVVAAPWVEQDNEQALRVLADEMKKRLPTNQLERVSRIVLLDPGDASVRAITSEHPVEHGRVEIDEGFVYGFPVERGYVITARAA
jgi:predicted sugar kinase